MTGSHTGPDPPNAHPAQPTAAWRGVRGAAWAAGPCGSGSRLPSLNPAGCSERQPLPAAGRAGPQAPGSRGARRPLATARAKTVAAEAGEMRCPGHRARRTWTRRCAGSHWERTSSRACRAGTATPRTRPGPGHSSPGRGWGAQESVELSDVTRANPTPESQSEGRPRPFQLCCGFCVHDGSHSQVPQATADTFGDPELQSSPAEFTERSGIRSGAISRNTGPRDKAATCP